MEMFDRANVRMLSALFGVSYTVSYAPIVEEQYDHVGYRVPFVMWWSIISINGALCTSTTSYKLTLLTALNTQNAIGTSSQLARSICQSNTD